MEATGLWLGTTKNTKTGDVPTLWVGATREESKATCEGCSLLDSKGCYAQYQTQSFGHSAMVKARARGKRYTFEGAMATRRITARMARFAAIGDPSRINHPTLRRWIGAVTAAGLRPIGYTHHWRDPINAWLQDHFMASADSLTEADEALDAGWAATAVVPADFTGGTTPKGRKAIVCPAIAAQRAGRKLTCNQCRMCHPKSTTAIKHRLTVIVFPDHGPRARQRK